MSNLAQASLTVLETDFYNEDGGGKYPIATNRALSVKRLMPFENQEKRKPPFDKLHSRLNPSRTIRRSQRNRGFPPFPIVNGC